MMKVMAAEMKMMMKARGGRMKLAVNLILKKRIMKGDGRLMNMIKRGQLVLHPDNPVIQLIESAMHGRV
jgi:hypothetical protein